jgi:neopullulanase
MPQNGMYVYFRHDDTKTIMVIMSQNAKDQTLDTKRFAESMVQFTKGKSILDDKMLTDVTSIAVPANSVQVIELSK